MLVLTRRVGEAIVIPPLDVSVIVKSVKGRRARLAVSAPPEISVHREEVWLRLHQQPQPGVEDLPMEGVRILLADADDGCAARYEAYLSGVGYKVTIAHDGLSCVSHLRQRTPHLVVLDAGLLWGRADGVLGLMREQADMPDVPVLVTYDEGHRDTLSSLRPFGVDDYVAKPLTPQRLGERIRALLALPVEDSNWRS